MDAELIILGVSGAVPAHGRFPSAQVFRLKHQYFLLDCGEGAQMRMADFDIPKNKISQIFISHLHGDHVFGLPGLVFSYALADRKAPLDIFSPAGLEQMILAQTGPIGRLPYQVRFHVVDTEAPALIFENELLTVQSLPLKHHVPTVGYVFREKPAPLNVDPLAILAHSLTVDQIKAAKNGQDIRLDSGQVLPNAVLTLPPKRTATFAYITDTLCAEELVPYIYGVALLYHETTFMHELADLAEATMHSTARQAAGMARKAAVGKLVTGHYSSRYKDLSALLAEAKSVFENTVLGEEGRHYPLEA